MTAEVDSNFDWNVNKNWFSNPNESDEILDCKHPLLTEEGICEDCGLFVEEKINYNPEWKNYGGGDKTTKNTIQRCHSSKSPVKGNIDSLFIGKDIPKMIQDKIMFFYNQLKNDNTVRSNNRTLMVAVCYYYVCIDAGQYKTPEEVIEFFNIDKKSFSAGINKFLEVFKEYSKIDINPTHLFKRYIISLKIDECHYEPLVNFYNKLPKNNQELNRCKMTSVTVGIMYIYLSSLKEGNFINEKNDLKKYKKEFSNLSQLSEITITKVINIITTIMAENKITIF